VVGCTACSVLVLCDSCRCTFVIGFNSVSLKSSLHYIHIRSIFAQKAWYKLWKHSFASIFLIFANNNSCAVSESLNGTSAKTFSYMVCSYSSCYSYRVLSTVRSFHDIPYWVWSCQVFTACSELRKVLFLAPSVCGFLVYEISQELLNGFAPNLHIRHVWSFTRMSLRVKGQDHQGQKWHFLALSAACVQFVFDKTSLVKIHFVVPNGISLHFLLSSQMYMWL